jgi:hypothetical protein
MTYHEEYRQLAHAMADTLEQLAADLRTRSYQQVAATLSSLWLGPLVADLAGLGQFAELCRVWDAHHLDANEPHQCGL